MEYYYFSKIDPENRYQPEFTILDVTHIIKALNDIASKSSHPRVYLPLTTRDPESEFEQMCTRTEIGVIANETMIGHAMVALLEFIVESRENLFVKWKKTWEYDVSLKQQKLSELIHQNTQQEEIVSLSDELFRSRGVYGFIHYMCFSESDNEISIVNPDTIHVDLWTIERMIQYIQTHPSSKHQMVCQQHDVMHKRYKIK
jgi:hypothetical protein